ncbi:MAG: type II toxin-antitoxin system ParD family antitoxin [Pseudomonadales bacterium]|nr:type II toxin-antitoxin system ParD family antitoxin [Pseudomonadales bacterium]MBL4867808.1 type II toxin-antitoxin system ParD family antitoxin [Pseudomonadales bacterium]
MATMNISVPDPMRDWVDALVNNGKYASNSDYVRDLIRKDQDRNDKFQALQDAITQGIESGDPKAFNVENFKKRMQENLDNGSI